MPQASSEDLKETIQELVDYRARLTKEVISMAKKLKMPPKKIDIMIKDHSELNLLSKVLCQLTTQLENS